jgi:hypothetical protein
MLNGDGLFIAGASALTGLLAALLAWHVSGSPAAHPDFAMTWTAVQQPRPYDQAHLNAVLNWGARLEAAFAYPPTALPIYGALATLPMRLALALWAVISGLAMGLASRSKWSPLLILVPAVLWALPGGQTSVLLGSLLLGSLLVARYPALSGILAGIALSVKPQVALVVPLALLIDRRWAALLWACITFAAMALLSALIFGPSQWIDWYHSLPRFLKRLELNTFWRANEISFGLPIWSRAVALIGGGWLAARALRRDNPVEAFVIATGAALIGSVHALGYEFAMFAAAAPALIARRQWSSPAMILFMLMPVLIWAGLPALPWRLIALLLLVCAAAVDGALELRYSISLKRLIPHVRSVNPG